MECLHKTYLRNLNYNDKSIEYIDNTYIDKCNLILFITQMIQR